MSQSFITWQVFLLLVYCCIHAIPKKEWSDVCKRMHRLAFVMYLCLACRCVVLVLQKLCTTAKYFFVRASRLALGWLSVRITVTLGLRLGIGIGLGVVRDRWSEPDRRSEAINFGANSDRRCEPNTVHFYKQYNFRRCLGFCRDRKLEYTQLTFQSSIRLNPVFSTLYLSLSLAEKHRECYFPSTWTDI